MAHDQLTRCRGVPSKKPNNTFPKRQTGPRIDPQIKILLALEVPISEYRESFSSPCSTLVLGTLCGADGAPGGRLGIDLRRAIDFDRRADGFRQNVGGVSVVA
jgi:hypothetical protein